MCVILIFFCSVLSNEPTYHTVLFCHPERKTEFSFSFHFADGEIEFVHHLDSEKVTEGTLELMQTQYEWLFIDMTVKKENVNNFGFFQSQMVYTVGVSGFRQLQGRRKRGCWGYFSTP